MVWVGRKEKWVKSGEEVKGTGGKTHHQHPRM